jgi:nucleotide-binding universal stress UspA family protein
MTAQSVGKMASQRIPPSIQMGRHAGTKKRVLCATDLSPRAQRAVARATRLARQLDAELTLLHVIDRAEFAAHPAGARDEIAQQWSSIGVSMRHEPKIRVRTGSYVETIASVAKELDADIIVLGAQRRKAMAPLMGTTAERIVALASRPALVVNLDAHVRYGGVVIAAELSDAFIQVVRIAASLRFLEAGRVAVVHGFEFPYRGPLYAEGFDIHAAKRNMEAWERAARARLLLNLDAAGVESSHFHLIFQQARPIRAIQRVMRSVQPELLIMGTKERSIFTRVTRASVANDVLRSIDCDILVAAPKNESVPGALNEDAGAQRMRISLQAQEPRPPPI